MASGDEASHMHPSGRTENTPAFTGEHGEDTSQKHASSGGIPRVLRSSGDLALVIALLIGVWILLTYVWHLRTIDVTEYFKYAHDFWYGQPRFRLLPLEYPPLSLVPFSLTLLPALPDHYAVFAFWMGVLVLLTFAAYLRFSTRIRGLAFVVYLVVGAFGLFLVRFDLAPACVTLLALWAAERRRFRLAYILIACGVLLKLYPAFLFPVIAVAQWRAEEERPAHTADASDTGRVAAPLLMRFRELARSRGLWRVARELGLGVGLVLLGFGISFVLNGEGTLSSFHYAMARPVQIESLPATLMWFGNLIGIPAQLTYAFHSYNYVGKLGRVFLPLSEVALIGGCALVYWRQLLGRLTLRRAFLATLCIVLISNKIFSPQYLIWAIPLAAEVEGFDLAWLLVCLLTSIEYPIIFEQDAHRWAVDGTYFAVYMSALALRNAILVFITLRLLTGERLWRKARQ